MVKILANGEVVQDNDPRIKTAPRDGQRRMGGIRHGADEDERQEGGEGQQGWGPSPSIFDSLNQRLKDAGLPSVNLGDHEIEPIVYVAFLLAFFLLGLKGLIFGLVLFIIVKLSSGTGGFGQLLNSFFGGRQHRNTQGQSRSDGNRLGGRVIRRR